ncbi:hypothetical protein BDV3_002585 [Batrachochytrium dendrobatidis]
MSLKRDIDEAELSEFARSGKDCKQMSFSSTHHYDDDDEDDDDDISTDYIKGTSVLHLNPSGNMIHVSNKANDTTRANNGNNQISTSACTSDYLSKTLKQSNTGTNSGNNINDATGFNSLDTGFTRKRTAGRRKIKIEYIEDKSRRHITFSKRKAGIMKKAYELSTLTGTQVLLLVASETGHVYTFATPKLQPLITNPEGKSIIQSCLNTPDEGINMPPPDVDFHSVNFNRTGMSADSKYMMDMQLENASGMTNIDDAITISNALVDSSLVDLNLKNSPHPPTSNVQTIQQLSVDDLNPLNAPQLHISPVSPLTAVDPHHQIGISADSATTMNRFPHNLGILTSGQDIENNVGPFPTPTSAGGANPNVLSLANTRISNVGVVNGPISLVKPTIDVGMAFLDQHQGNYNHASFDSGQQRHYDSHFDQNVQGSGFNHQEEQHKHLLNQQHELMHNQQFRHQRVYSHHHGQQGYPQMSGVGQSSSLEFTNPVGFSELLQPDNGIDTTRDESGNNSRYSSHKQHHTSLRALPHIQHLQIPNIQHPPTFSSSISSQREHTISQHHNYCQHHSFAPRPYISTEISPKVIYPSYTYHPLVSGNINDSGDIHPTLYDSIDDDMYVNDAKMMSDKGVGDGVEGFGG